MTRLQGIIEKNNRKCIALGLRRVWVAGREAEKATAKTLAAWNRGD